MNKQHKVGSSKLPDKKENRNPISKELSRTKQYQLALTKVYGGFITVAFDSVYKGTKFKVSHYCSLCQGTSIVKPTTMLNGSGCKVCRTNANHIDKLMQHQNNLNTANNFRLIFNPVTFNSTTKYYYQCRRCNSQLHARPSEIDSISCTYCSKAKGREVEIQIYRRRLDMLYNKTIKHIGQFSLTHPILHSCELHSPAHTWFDTALSMFRGKGCPRCKKPIDIKSVSPFSLNSRMFTVRNLAERRALKGIKKLGYKMSEVFTALDYLIPNTFGRHVPAFYIRNTNTVYDIISQDKVDERIPKIIRSREICADLGFKYGVIILVNDDKDKNKILIASGDRFKLKQQKPIKSEEEKSKELEERKERKEKRETLKEKRLAYIFNSPEATRVYKEAIKKQANRIGLLRPLKTKS